MSAREDLLNVAAALAERASGAALSGQPITYESIRVAHLAEGARAALQAAALVDVDPGPVIQAIRHLEERMGPLISLDEALEVGGHAAAIEALGDVLEHYQTEIKTAAAVQHGYLRLRGLIEGLERDLTAARNPTASRTQARLRAGLDEAEQAIQAARTQEA